MTKYSHWTKDPKNAEKAALWRKNVGLAQKKDPKIPWQHRPENREKALAQAEVARKAKQAKQNTPFRQHLANVTRAIPTPAGSFVDQLQALHKQVDARLMEIEKEITKLETERQLLKDRFGKTATLELRAKEE